MKKETTDVLKQEKLEPTSPSKRVFTIANEIVKSPLFVFVFGASFATIYPTIQAFFTPESELEFQHRQAQAREDAILLAPFIANLSASEPGKFEASRAALKALEEVSQRTDKSGDRPIFKAVNKAVEAVAVQIRPPTDKGELTAEVIQQIDNSAVDAKLARSGGVVSYTSFKDTVVYIQVDSSNRYQQGVADTLRDFLLSKSILTPDIEKMAMSTMPKRNQIRYFHDSDLSRAEDLAAIVTQATKLNVYVVKPGLSAKPGTLEIWFGKE
ncbi:MAG: hypothetical protein HGB23_00105 [Chlorobiaceae bacterium]|nr:hypothetical protein [Chlorobiaceae bacterium]